MLTDKDESGSDHQFKWISKVAEWISVFPFFTSMVKKISVVFFNGPESLAYVNCVLLSGISFSDDLWFILV